MNKVIILTRKELTEILRDKKTLIIMIVMPLILYPLILIVMTMGISMLLQSQMDTTHVIAYNIDDEKYIKELKEIYEDNIDDIDYILEFTKTGDEADAWVDFTEKNGVINIHVAYTSTDENSDYAEEGLYSLVELYREKLLMENLEAEGLSQEFLYPVEYESTDSATVSESVGMSLGGSIGMILIVMIMMGAFYPAVDVTTGEKERGTLETLLTLPVTNFQMIMSKYIAVSFMACITAIVSIIALGGSVLFMMFGLPSEYVGEIGQIPLGAFVSGIPVLALAVIATALLITAVSMSFCIFAKSSKEANNYMTPVMLIVMMASMAGVIPTINLDYKTSLIPIVNVSLLVKQILAQQLNLALAGTTILVNAGCSVIAIWIIARIYDSEDVLFNDGFHSFKLFQKRSEIKKGTVPEIGDTVLCLAVLLILMIYISVIVGTRSLFAGTFVTQLAILVIPIALAWYMKSDVKTLFNINSTKLGNFITCIFIYIGTFLLVNVLSVILTSVFTQSTENLEISYDELINHPFIMVAIVMAVMPAIGEELLFRGLLLGSFKYKYGWRIAIIASSLIFGAYHMSLVKFIPTALLGMCLAYAVEKSGSIFVSMFIHFINNFISVLAMKYPDFTGEIMPFLTKESFTSAELVLMFIIAMLAIITGMAISTFQEKNLAK